MKAASSLRHAAAAPFTNLPCIVVVLLAYCLASHYNVLQVKALSLEQTTTTLQTTTTVLPVGQVHRQYANLSEGKHTSQRVAVTVVVEEVKPTSPRLVFLRAHDDNAAAAAADDDDDGMIELLLRERDSFLSRDEIDQIATAVQRQGATLQCVAFPEKLGLFDGPSFFPHRKTPLSSSTGVCLHVVAANVTLATGDVLLIRPTERPLPPTTTTPPPPTPAVGNNYHNTLRLPGRMPPIHLSGQRRTNNKSRGGGGNRDRGGIFAAWVLETFGPTVLSKGGILDVAGGAGQMAFQFGVRRGWNITVVDPRPLRLASDQQRTLQYHRKMGLRLLPNGRDPSLPQSDYGHHFAQAIVDPTTISTHPQQPPTTIPTGDHSTTWLVGGEAHVRHLATWFDSSFASTDTWRNDASIVLGMHPDEATEDIVDLALAHNKPFAVVPCCVFWKRDPHRKVPRTGQPVRTWEHFCEYLVAKDPTHIQTATLPFSGRNTVLYSLGK